MRSLILSLLVSTALLSTACEKKKEEKKQTAFEKRVDAGKRTVIGPDGRKVVVVTPQKHPLYVIVDTDPRNDYERTLSKLLYKVMNPDALQMFCGQWYPDSSRQVADAYIAWREKNSPVIKEVMDRRTEVWTELAGEDVEYVKLVYPHLRKQLLKGITQEFDRSPAEKFKKVCADYPKQMASGKWNLAKAYAGELAELRRQPLKPVAAN